MPPYLLDTNAISDVMVDHPRLRARLVNPPGPLVTSVIVRGEILYGLERLPLGKRRSNLRLKADMALAALPLEPIVQAMTDEYASVRAAIEKIGLSLDDNDLWIAATVLTIGAILVTRDQDFSSIPGLQVEDWTL